MSISPHLTPGKINLKPQTSYPNQHLTAISMPILERTHMRYNKTRLTTLALAYLTALLVGGCNDLRVRSYPPDLVYLDDKQVESSMLSLSADIWSINDIFDNNEYISSFNRERIIALLREMEEQADTLGAGTQKTNHLLIDNYIDQFKSDVEAARLAVEAEAPNYYLAGRLSGSCLACHVRR